jgi:RNA polymerase-binding transcription factor DksA
VGNYTALKKKLLDRQKFLSVQLGRLKKDISKSHASDWSEQAQERENDEVLDQLGGNVENELVDVNSALNRMEADSYGTCISCSSEIPQARLEIKPEVAYCMDCVE